MILKFKEKFPNLESYIKYIRLYENSCRLCKSTETIWATRVNEKTWELFKCRECNCSQNSFKENYFFTPNYKPIEEIEKDYLTYSANLWA